MLTAIVNWIVTAGFVILVIALVIRSRRGR